MEEIDIAKQYWALEKVKPQGTSVSLSELHPDYLPNIPRCPNGGTYEVGKLGEDPTCSMKGHWHERHYFLNYARPEFVAGKRIRFEGRSKNTRDGAYVELGDEKYRLDGLERWPTLHSERKVTAFGVLAEAKATNVAFVIKQPAYQFGWSYDENADACLNGLRRIESAQQQWAIDNSKGDDEIVKMSELVRASYLRRLPTCQSGGIYIVGNISDSPTCTLHKNSLPQQ